MSVLVLSVCGCYSNGAPGDPLEIDEYDSVMDAWTDELFAVPFPQSHLGPFGPYWDESQTRSRIERFDELLAELEQIDPPTEVAAEHADLVSSTTRMLQLEKEFFAACAIFDTETADLKFEAVKEENAVLADAFDRLQQAVREAR